MNERIVNEIILGVIAIFMLFVSPQWAEIAVDIERTDWLLYYPTRIITNFLFLSSFVIILFIVCRSWTNKH